MKIGIISDTHGMLRPEVMENLKGCNIILHCGDINRQLILDKLWEIAPVNAVRGNCDREWAEDIPLQLSFELGGIRICMAHMKKDLPDDWAEHDLVILGHTHRYDEWRHGDTVMLNPGSCGPIRFDQPVTMAVAELADGKLSITRIDIPDETAGGIKDRFAGARERASGIRSKARDLRDKARRLRENARHSDNSAETGPSPDLKRQIEVIMAETRRRRTPEQIAAKYGIDKELVDQIVRLYLTHPGVTADGILAKMGY